MRRAAQFGLVLSLAFTVSQAAADEGENQVPTALKPTMKSLDDKDVKLSEFHGKVILAVNVASECGLTPQYEQLQDLHEKYKDKGLVVLGFPCNQFGKQEPGTADEIQTFCKENYGVTFPMMAKVEVNGEEACDFYQHLTMLDLKPKGPGKVSWNFEKFIISRAGEAVARFEPKVSPDDEALIKAIEAELAKEQ